MSEIHPFPQTRSQRLKPASAGFGSLRSSTHGQNQQRNYTTLPGFVKPNPDKDIR